VDRNKADNKLASVRCIACGKSPTEHHHFKTRGSGGTDDHWNLLELCRLHHQEIHKIGRGKFIDKHPKVFYWLTQRGWESYEQDNIVKWRHEK